MEGNVAEVDYRLKGSDAVVAIELIEHLEADVLEKFPYTVFEYTEPRLVIVTTPNADFNVFFPNLANGGFRHPDHKFEWTRKQFQEWSVIFSMCYVETMWPLFTFVLYIGRTILLQSTPITISNITTSEYRGGMASTRVWADVPKWLFSYIRIIRRKIILFFRKTVLIFFQKNLNLKCIFVFLSNCFSIFR